jgi:hypothetical protein
MAGNTSRPWKRLRIELPTAFTPYQPVEDFSFILVQNTNRVKFSDEPKTSVNADSP